MESTIGQTFFNRGHTRDMLKDFAIVKNFELQRIRTDSQRVTAKCRNENCTWRMHASIDKGIESFTIRRYYEEHSYSMPGSTKNHKQTKSSRIASIMKYRIARHPRTTPVKIRMNIQRDFSVHSYHRVWKGKELTHEQIHSS